MILGIELGRGSLSDYLRKKKRRFTDEEASTVMR